MGYTLRKANYSDEVWILDLLEERDLYPRGFRVSNYYILESDTGERVATLCTETDTQTIIKNVASTEEQKKAEVEAVKKTVGRLLKENGKEHSIYATQTEKDHLRRVGFRLLKTPSGLSLEQDYVYRWLTSEERKRVREKKNSGETDSSSNATNEPSPEEFDSTSVEGAAAEQGYSLSGSGVETKYGDKT